MLLILFSSAPPSAVQNVRVTEPVDNTTVKVHWDPPLSNGGRTDGFHYNVEYREVGDLGSWIRANDDRIRSNMYLIRGLTPVTRYMIRIIAGNNVSDQEPESVGDRTTTSIVKTTEGGKFLHCFKNSIIEVFLEVAVIYILALFLIPQIGKFCREKIFVDHLNDEN